MASAPSSPPPDVYVDSAYAGMSGQVTFPAAGGTGAYHIGYDAFPAIQSGLTAVAAGGRVHIAPGNYMEDVSIMSPVSLLGPNAGKAGTDPTRGPEAVLMPATADPESGQVIYLGANEVVLDGLLFDSQNPAFTPAQGYGAGPSRVYSSAAVQNTLFWTTEFAQVERVTFRNNIVRHFSYDGIYLELALGTTNGFNYILNNKFDTLWEGISTYALQSVISNNTFVSVNRGVELHGTTVPAAAGFCPAVVSNSFTIAEWWPTNIDRRYSAGVWVDYRRQQAAPLEIRGNAITTPVSAPSGKTIRGFYVLTVAEKGKVNFVDNTVNGGGNCQQGLFAAGCWSNNAVQVIGGSFNNILEYGLAAATLDPVYGAGDSFLTVSNVNIQMAPSGAGAAAVQEASTPSNRARVTVLGHSSITGAAAGVLVKGTNAEASVLNNSGRVCGNGVGVQVDGGKALIEGTILTNNSGAAIRNDINGRVDAGDCSGGNISGLGTGTGPNGSSAGLNELSGYGFDGTAPFAVINAGAVPVMAQENHFGASPLDNIGATVSGLVSYAQANGLVASCPPPLTFECLSEVPAGATSLAEFLALGGSVSANPATVTFADVIRPGTAHVQVLTRTYTVTDLCGQAVSCDQTLTISDTTPPSPACPANLVRCVEPGQNYALVNFSLTATDNCDATPQVEAVPPPGAFPLGTTLVTVTATDASGNSSSCAFNVTVVVPPFITSQPAGVAVPVGSPAAFNVSAGGTAPLHYQWRQNGLVLLGQTTTALNIAAVADSDWGDYTVEVSNLGGSVLSAPAHLSPAHPPTLSAQPADLTVNLGEPAGFSVSANGLVPFAYQWQKDDVNIAGATARILNFSRALAGDLGSYRVVVSNADGTATSRAASLSILFPPTELTLVRSNEVSILSVGGADGYRYALFGNTNPAVADWVGLWTNTAPYSFRDTNNTAGPLRFYRGRFVP